MKRRLPFFSLLLLLCVSAAFAQEDCPALVDEALTRVGEACSGLGRNQVCYGNNLITAADWQQAELEDFATSGDVVGVENIATLATAGLDVTSGDWGIAVLSLQANLPDSLPGQNVTFVVFGDVQVESENDPDAESADDEFSAPMQAFRFVSSVGESACAEAPRNGMLVQAPQSTTVTFMINGIRVDVGSTAYLTAAANNELQVSTFGGSVALTSGGETQIATAGFSVSAVEGDVPTEPIRIDFSEFEGLPLGLLDIILEVLFELPDFVPTVSGESLSVTIPGNATDWVDSGVNLTEGALFTLTAVGEVSIWPGCDEFCPTLDPARNIDCSQLCPAVSAGPDGSAPAGQIVPDSEPYYPLPSANMVALLARIGDGAPFVAGANATFIADREGALQFRVNEDSRFLGDESGAFEVEVSVLSVDE